MKEKRFLPLYDEHLHLLMKRAGWIVTKIYTHYTFEQSKFKKDILIMNQVSCQKATTSVEKDFYKLMNNTNFAHDCRNNIANCKFNALYDENDEFYSIQKYVSLYFNDAYKDFACPMTMKQQMEQEYNTEMMKIDSKDLCAEAKKYSLGQKQDSKIDAVDAMIAKKA